MSVVIKILKTISTCRGGATLDEICRSTDIPSHIVSKEIHRLIQRGIVMRVDREKYKLALEHERQEIAGKIEGQPPEWTKLLVRCGKDRFSISHEVFTFRGELLRDIEFLRGMLEGRYLTMGTIPEKHRHTLRLMVERIEELPWKERSDHFVLPEDVFSIACTGLLLQGTSAYLIHAFNQLTELRVENNHVVVSKEKFREVVGLMWDIVHSAHTSP